MTAESDMQAAREALKQKYGGRGKIGGKGSVRRKKKAVHRSNTNDDKKLQQSFRRLGIHQQIAVEEVAMVCEDSTMMVFRNPKVTASLPANTFVVSGGFEETSYAPPAGMDMSAMAQKVAEQQAEASGENADDDDDVPDLVDNFEEVSESN